MFLSGQMAKVKLFRELLFCISRCKHFSLELQYLSCRQLQFSQNANDNKHYLLWKYLNNVAAFLCITRYSLIQKCIFSIAVSQCKGERKNLMHTGALCSFLTSVFSIFAFILLQNCISKKFTCLPLTAVSSCFLILRL